MTVFVKRETLHQLIDDLPEQQLLELAKFVEFLSSKNQQSASSFDLWAPAVFDKIKDRPDAPQDIPAGDDLYDLNEVVRAIKNTPLNEQAITFPTKTWAEYAAEITGEEDISLDVAAWNETWDEVEAEMEASSLAHEEFERQEQGA